MEGLSKMKRQDCSGAFLEIIFRGKLPKMQEGLLKIDVWEFTRGSSRQLAAASGSSRQLAEMGQQVQPRTYLPHAPEIRMT